ncbi:MAG: DUF4126 family protein [Pyrinomonadaceae bacterium]
MNIYIKAVFAGVIAGMRTFSAPAFVSRQLAGAKTDEFSQSPFGFLSSRQTANILKIMAAGEMVGDKLPMMPARILPAPLIARIASGAVCGAALCKSKNERADAGAFIGGLAAIISAYGFYYLRRELAENTRLPDVLLGAAEDALAIEIGLRVIDERKKT